MLSIQYNRNGCLSKPLHFVKAGLPVPGNPAFIDFPGMGNPVFIVHS